MNASTDQPAAPLKKRHLLAEAALVFVVFAIQGAAAAPAVNEPYYLIKAAHYWNPEVIPGDFFLESQDTHTVFYFTFGWLSLWLPLLALAWVGRVLTWALLAWAWCRMSRALLPRPYYAILSAVLFGALIEHCHIAGEWVVGGVEAKGFAFVLVFLGIEALLRGHWNRTWLLLGAASALHVLVGGWSVVAAMLAWLFQGKQRPPLGSMWPGLLGGFLLSLPALLPSLLLNRHADPEVVRQTHYVYVYERLAHHLAPMLVSWAFCIRGAILLLTWIVLCWLAPNKEAGRRLRGFVGGSIVIALVGSVLCAWGHFDRMAAAGLLRFYWFRLVDVMLPLGIVLLMTVAIASSLKRKMLLGKICLAAAVGAATVQLAWHVKTLATPGPPVAFRLSNELSGWFSWKTACDWVSQSGKIPKDARFLTPRMSQTFKWYAGRAEVANWKEVPQDADTINRWWRRMIELHATGDPAPKERWYRSLVAIAPARMKQIEPIGARESFGQRNARWLKTMGKKYQADYVITLARHRLALPVVYPERGYPKEPNAFVIYQLSDVP